MMGLRGLQVHGKSTHPMPMFWALFLTRKNYFKHYADGAKADFKVQWRLDGYYPTATQLSASLVGQQ